MKNNLNYTRREFVCSAETVKSRPQRFKKLETPKNYDLARLAVSTEIVNTTTAYFSLFELKKGNAIDLNDLKGVMKGVMKM